MTFNPIRRQIYRTAVLQEQLIACCCEEEPPATEEADLEITKQFEPPTGTLVQSKPAFIITVENRGSVAAQNVIVKDHWPNGIDALEFETIPPDSWTQTTTSPFVAKLDKLEPGAKAVFFIIFSFREEGTTFENTATVERDNSDVKSVTIEFP